jgi:hypothetical protein
MPALAHSVALRAKSKLDMRHLMPLWVCGIASDDTRVRTC